MISRQDPSGVEDTSMLGPHAINQGSAHEDSSVGPPKEVPTGSGSPQAGSSNPCSVEVSLEAVPISDASIEVMASLESSEQASVDSLFTLLGPHDRNALIPSEHMAAPSSMLDIGLESTVDQLSSTSAVPVHPAEVASDTAVSAARSHKPVHSLHPVQSHPSVVVVECLSEFMSQPMVKLMLHVP